VKIERVTDFKKLKIMKKIFLILITILSTSAFSQNFQKQRRLKLILDEGDHYTIYLKLGTGGSGSMCGAGFNYKTPSDFDYKTFGAIDLNKLYNIPYDNGKTFWTKFGGWGRKEDTNGFNSGCIDDNNKNYVSNEQGTNVGVFKFPEVNVHFQTWVWINVMSQCHGECGSGTWWKFEQHLSADESWALRNTHTDLSFVENTLTSQITDISSQGFAVCNSFGGNYGCGSNEQQ
jgi:hypothetical protein|tara:strand:+ start:1117 stop:1812 length:696 start_codon:yes stop_codon:yes gene_type:complete